MFLDCSTKDMLDVSFQIEWYSTVLKFVTYFKSLRGRGILDSAGSRMAFALSSIASSTLLSLGRFDPRTILLE